jgi:ribosome maturation factor RimP
LPAATAIEDALRRVLEGAGLGEERGLEVLDVEVSPSAVKVVLDSPSGTDLDLLASVSRVMSAELDSRDLFAGSNHLEVTSPGVERPLRRADHFQRHVGSVVSVRTRPGVPGERRVRGRLVSADEAGITVALEPLAQDGAAGPAGAGENGRRLAYEEIAKAHTVFEWGQVPRPAGSSAAAVRRGAGGR